MNITNTTNKQILPMNNKNKKTNNLIIKLFVY